MNTKHIFTAAIVVLSLGSSLIFSTVKAEITPKKDTKVVQNYQNSLAQMMNRYSSHFYSKKEGAHEYKVDLYELRNFNGPLSYYILSRDNIEEYAAEVAPENWLYLENGKLTHGQYQVDAVNRGDVFSIKVYISESDNKPSNGIINVITELPLSGC